MKLACVDRPAAANARGYAPIFLPRNRITWSAMRRAAVESIPIAVDSLPRCRVLRVRTGVRLLTPPIRAIYAILVQAGIVVDED